MKSIDQPWAPYEPSPKEPWDLRKVAHLHRRAGFGANWAELHRDLKAGPAESIERILRPATEDRQFHQVADALKGAVAASAESLGEGDPRAARVWWLALPVLGGAT